jgi:hypothetical protein
MQWQALAWSQKQLSRVLPLIWINSDEADFIRWGTAAPD